MAQRTKQSEFEIRIKRRKTRVLNGIISQQLRKPDESNRWENSTVWNTTRIFDGERYPFVFNMSGELE